MHIYKNSPTLNANLQNSYRKYIQGVHREGREVGYPLRTKGTKYTFNIYLLLLLLLKVTICRGAERNLAPGAIDTKAAPERIPSIQLKSTH